VRTWTAIKAAASRVWDRITGAVGKAIGWLKDLFMRFHPVGIFIRHWGAIRDATSRAWGRIRDWLGGAVRRLTELFMGFHPVGLFVRHWGAIREKTVEIWGRIREGVSRAVGRLIETVRGLPGRILRALGNVATLLYGAGRSIMDGLLDGLKRAWDNVAGWVGGVADKIKGLKGPIGKDRTLLIAEGAAIMEGLGAGLRAGWGDVSRDLSRMTAAIPAAAGPSPGLMATTLPPAPASPPRGGDIVLELDGREIGRILRTDLAGDIYQGQQRVRTRLS